MQGRYWAAARFKGTDEFIQHLFFKAAPTEKDVRLVIAKRFHLNPESVDIYRKIESPNSFEYSFPEAV
jgi:hypothetical protein